MKMILKTTLSILLISILSISIPVTSFALCPISTTTSHTASQEVEKYYVKLPKALRSQFEADGWEIMISDVTADKIMKILGN